MGKSTDPSRQSVLPLRFVHPAVFSSFSSTQSLRANTLPRLIIHLPVTKINTFVMSLNLLAYVLETMSPAQHGQLFQRGLRYSIYIYTFYVSYYSILFFPRVLPGHHFSNVSHAFNLTLYQSLSRVRRFMSPIVVDVLKVRTYDEILHETKLYHI